MLQRQISNLPAPLVRFAAFGDQQKIVNCQTNRYAPRHLENSWHRHAGRDSFEGKSCDSRYVMSQQYAILLCSPRKDVWIVRTGKSHILNSNKA